MRTRSLFLVVLLSLAPALQADVGFRLPYGSRSRANTAKGYLIRLDALPFAGSPLNGALRELRFRRDQMAS